MAISTKKSIAAKKAEKPVAKKLPNLPVVPDQEPVVSKTKGKLPEIVAKKTTVAKPVKEKKNTVHSGLSARARELLIGQKHSNVEIREVIAKEFDGAKVSLSGIRKSINAEGKIKLVLLTRDESGKLIEKVKSVKKEKGTSKIKLAMASLKK